MNTQELGTNLFDYILNMQGDLCKLEDLHKVFKMHRYAMRKNLYCSFDMPSFGTYPRCGCMTEAVSGGVQGEGQYGANAVDF